MTSPSTLIRRATAASNPSVAKRLRTQAAKLRRDIRAKDAAGLKITKALESASRNKAERKGLSYAKLVNDARYLIEAKMPDGQQPKVIMEPTISGWRAVGPEGVIGDRVAVNRLDAGQEVAKQAAPVPLISDADIELIRKTAFSRKYPDRFAIAVRAAVVNGKAAGREEAYAQTASLSQQYEERERAQRDAHAIAIVSSFMARVQAAEMANGGPVPKTMIIDGLTIARVYDALRMAGYTTEGKQGGIRNSRI